MNFLDYRSSGAREKVRTARWGLRYAIFSPIFGICYFALVVATAIIALSHEPPRNPRIDALVSVVSFPFVGLTERPPYNNWDCFFGAIAANAVVWGIVPMVVWHLIYAIKRWRTSRS
jgi:hypothetical protein